MKKNITAMLVIASMTAAMAGTSALADDVIRVYVNGNNVSFQDIDPFIENGHTLVPMRQIFEALGATVEWDEETRTVTSYHSTSDTTITLVIDSDTMVVNDNSVTLETPAMVVNDRTVVPVRAIAEGFGITVSWDDASRTVYVGETSSIVTPDNVPSGAPTIDTSEHWTDFDDVSSLESAVGFPMITLSNDSSQLTKIRQNTDTNIAEIQYVYSMPQISEAVLAKPEPAVVTLRKQSGSAENISGYPGGAQDDEYETNGVTVKINTYQSIMYALFETDTDSYCIAIETSYSSPKEKYDELVKLVDEVTSHI